MGGPAKAPTNKEPATAKPTAGQAAAEAAAAAKAAAEAAVAAAASAEAVMKQTQTVLKESGVKSSKVNKQVKRPAPSKSTKAAPNKSSTNKPPAARSKTPAAANGKKKASENAGIRSRKIELWNDLWVLLQKFGWKLGTIKGQRLTFICTPKAEPKLPFRRRRDYFESRVQAAKFIIEQAQQGVQVATQHAAGTLALAEAYVNAHAELKAKEGENRAKNGGKPLGKPGGWCKGSAEADAKAKKWFETHKKGDKMKDKDLEYILETWNHNKNQSRINVIPDGTPFVHSEMLGLIRIRAYNKLVMAAKSRLFPNVTKALCRYLDDNPPKGLPKGKRFPYTSICLNKDYAASRHRDINNAGLTIVRAFGSFTGGTLKHWPKDPGPRFVKDVTKLPNNEAVEHDVAGKTVIVDSTKAHEVQAFKGTRYSLVYYTVPGYEKADEELREDLEKICSLHVPDIEKARKIWATWGWKPEPTAEERKQQQRLENAAAKAKAKAAKEKESNEKGKSKGKGKDSASSKLKLASTKAAAAKAKSKAESQTKSKKNEEQQPKKRPTKKEQEEAKKKADTSPKRARTGSQ